MESFDAMDFFGDTAGPGAIVSTAKGVKAKPSGQASSSVPTKSSSQAGPSKVNGSQGKGSVGRDVKGKGKADHTDTQGDKRPRAKELKSPPSSASAPGSTAGDSTTKSAAVARVRSRLAGKLDSDETDTAKRKSKTTKGKTKRVKDEGGSRAENGLGSKNDAGGIAKVKKGAQPFPMAKPTSKVDSDSDDEISLPGEYSKKQETAAAGPSNTSTQRSSTLIPSSQTISQRAKPKNIHDPITTPRGPIRNRTLSRNHLQDITSNSPDVLAGPTAVRPRLRNKSDVFADVATLFTRQPEKVVLVASSSMSSAGENERPQKKKRRTRPTEGHDDTLTDEDDGTPRPGKPGSKTDPVKARKLHPPRVDDNGATDFFAELSKKSTQERQPEAKLASQAQVIEYVMSSQEMVNEELDGIELDDAGDVLEEFTAEELEYCARFTEATNLCKFCDLPLPKEFSARLRKMKSDLIHLQATLPRGTPMDWEYFDPFCRQHEAETTVIPLGIRAGFPKTITFSELRPTLEQPWIRSRLEKFCTNPSSSTFYNDTLEAMRKLGHSQWQKSEKILAASFPGYYGDIGLNILMDHFLALRQWKLLAIPGLVKKDPHNFIQTVLVPEAAVMLIMVDRGWTADTDTEEGKREEAMKIRADSWKYGHAAFPDASQEGSSRAEEKEWIIKYHRARGLPVPLLRKKKRKTAGDAKAQAIEVSSDAGLSHSDVSELSASEASGFRLASSRGGSDDEATDGENVLSRSTVHSDIVSTPPFAGSSTLAAIEPSGENDIDDDGVEADTTIKFAASQASTVYGDELDETMMAEALAQTEAAVRGRRGKSRG